MKPSRPHDPWDARTTVCELLCDAGTTAEKRRVVVEYNDDDGRARLALYAQRDGLWQRIETMGEADAYARRDTKQ